MSKWMTHRKLPPCWTWTKEPFRRIVKSSKNPPPFVRPSERSMLFDVDALMKWRESWTVCGKQTRHKRKPTNGH